MQLPAAKTVRDLPKKKGVDYLFICPVQKIGWITPVPGWVYHGTDGPQLYKVMP